MDFFHFLLVQFIHICEIFFMLFDEPAVSGFKKKKNMWICSNLSSSCPYVTFVLFIDASILPSPQRVKPKDRVSDMAWCGVVWLCYWWWSSASGVWGFILSKCIVYTTCSLASASWYLLDLVHRNYMEISFECKHFSPEQEQSMYSKAE